MSTNPRARAWLQLRADALLANYHSLRSAVGSGVRMIPMVKADAYGLGMEGVVARLERGKPWAWGVATAEEGLRLRAAGVSRPVIVFSPTPPDSVRDAVQGGLTLSVSDLDAVRRISAAAEGVGRPADVHVEVDTGMGRAGVDWTVREGWLPAFRALLGDRVRWAGLFTHLHSAERDADSVRLQWERFQTWMEGVDRASVLCHTLNSAGVLRAPEMAADAVRPGIFLYGGGCGSELPPPRPVASLQARVVHVRDASPGTTLGYGATHRAPVAERWATLAIGYGDGLPRALGNVGHALIQGARVPIVGRISMDVTVVNITDVPGVGVGDVATLIGEDGSEAITVDEVAAQAGTISYEILTGLTARLPRVWVDVDET